jgi:hypothetical protein
MQKLETVQALGVRLQAILHTVETEFAPLPIEQLRQKPANGGWSIVECLQHLNLAERFYIRNLQHKTDALTVGQPHPTDQPLESDWVGKLLIQIVDPKSKTKFPAPGLVRPRPATDLDPADVMNQFVALQTTLLGLLDKAVYADWNRDKIPTLFGNWLKIRLGDALRMLVAHSERHINQAMRVKAEMGNFVENSTR